MVLDDPYLIPLADASYDLVYSGQTFEHAEFFWKTFAEMCRITKDGGLLIGAIAIYEGRKPSLGLVVVAACAGVGFWVAFVLLLGTEQPHGRFF